MTKRVFLGVLGLEVTLLLMLVALDWPERSTTQIAHVFGALASAAGLVALLLGVPLLLNGPLRQRGHAGIARTIFVVGLLLLLAVDYVAFIVPGVWESWERCLPPGSFFDGRCEVGPL